MVDVSYGGLNIARVQVPKVHINGIEINIRMEKNIEN
jgi:hypothetical protein